MGDRLTTRQTDPASSASGDRSSSIDIDRLWAPDEVLRVILSRAPALPTEWVPLHRAAGRTLAEPAVAPEDQPPFAAATMDGFAVVADDGSPWREILADQMAGHVVTVTVTPGTAVRITTGAPMPAGADAVVPVEETEVTEDHVIIEGGPAEPGQYIRPVGADVRAGDVLLPAGSVLGPAELGLVAGVGLVPVPVRRRPRVTIISTGDELVEPGLPPGPGQIRDTNRFSLLAAARREGVDLRWVGHAPDDAGPLETLLRDRIVADDIVITSGGVSMGERDLVKALLPGLATVNLRRVAMRPGKPFTFATATVPDPGSGTGERTTLIFGLPGNPVSALAGFELFIRPTIATMLGRVGWERPLVPVVLGEAIPSGDRTDYPRAVVRVAADATLRATTTGGQGSSRLASWVGANALLVLPPRDRPYAAGERVDALLLGAPLGPG